MAWKPRSSKMGGYLACDARAAFDRLVENGDMVKPEDSSSAYADLGTCEHFELQDGLRCTWMDGNSAAHKYTEEQFTNAATLFGRDRDRALAAMRHVAAYAAVRLPKPSDGAPWRAEWKFNSAYFTGTVDFLSADGKEVGDLKTTSRSPGGTTKYPHLIQMVCYHILTGAERGWIFYVDSKNGAWSTTVHIDFTTAAMQEMAEQLKAYAHYLKSKALFKVAVPRLGDHCSDNFCPYRGACRDRYMPAPGTQHDACIITAKSANAFGASPRIPPRFSQFTAG